MARRAHGAAGGDKVKAYSQTRVQCPVEEKASSRRPIATRASGASVACALLLAAFPALADDHADARFRGTGKADPIRIANVTVKPLGVPDASTITFDLAWDWSWRAEWEVSAEQHGGSGVMKLENWDAAWVFVKFNKPGDEGWQPAALDRDASHHTVPAGAALEPGLSNDRTSSVGVFIHRSSPGHGQNDWKGVTLRWLHGADDPAGANVRVLAIPMVFVPQGAFWAGDGTTAKIAGQFSAGTSDNPLRITSETALILGGEAAENLNNHDTRGMIGEVSMDDFNSAFSQPLPAAFPKGYAAFYCMKYEITQQQYVDFLNTLSFGQQRAFDLSDRKERRNGIKRKAAGLPRSTRNVARPDPVRASVSEIATPAVYETSAPHVACPWMWWSYGASYAAWAGLRPMTELEYEKACRGPLKPVPDEYAWGTAAIAGSNTNKPPHDGYALENPGMDDEHVVWKGANGPDETRGNAAWWGTVERGKGSFAINAINGPLRAGIFATPVSDRVAAGASYWGIMELSGNLWEMTVTVGNRNGRRFTGVHGDGTAVHAAGWRFITEGGRRESGNSFRRRGGSYGWLFDQIGSLRTSDRWGGSMQYSLPGAQWAAGFRCVRTAP
jgi:hypothetical protein